MSSHLIKACRPTYTDANRQTTTCSPSDITITCTISDLHEAAEPEDCVIEPTVFEVLLCAGLELHQRHLWVLCAMMDAEEDVALYAQCLQCI